MTDPHLRKDLTAFSCSTSDLNAESSVEDVEINITTRTSPQESHTASKNGLGMQKGHVFSLIFFFFFLCVRQSEHVNSVHDRFPISVQEVIQLAV